MEHDKLSPDVMAIKSPRLVLRKMALGDISEDYIQWLNDFETTKYLEVRFAPQTRRNVEDYVLNAMKSSSTYHLGVFDHGGSRLVGTVTLNNVDVHHLSASISFVIGHPDAKHRGYATEAVHATTYYMFSVKKFVKLWGGYYDGYKAAEKVFLKNGYKIEGRLKKKLVNYNGERVDHIYVGLCSQDFTPNQEIFGS